MGVPAIFAGQRTKLLTSKGLLLKDGTTIDNDGVPNFIRNYCGAIGTTGWVEGSYTAASRPSGNFTASSGAGAFAISTTTTTPLGTGTTSFLLTKSSGASRQGRAVETSFALPLSYRAKVLKIEADYIVNSGTFVAGSNTTDSSLIWYCAFSTDGGSTYTVAEPSSFKLLSNSTTISDKFSASIQTPSNATNMKLIAYVAEAANSAWVVETIVSVSPSQYVYGTPIKGLAPYTASLSYAGTVATNISSQTYRWAQTGDRLSIEGTIIFNGAANANGVFRIPLPPGLIVDTSKTSGAFQKLNGTVSFFQNSGSKFYGLGLPILDGATNGGANNYFLVNSVTYNGLSVQQWQGSTTGISNNPTGAALAAGDTLEFSISDIPILGWSSSVQVSDGYDGRVVAANVSRTPTGAQSIPNNTYTAIGFDAKAGDSTASWVLSRTSGSSYYLVPTAGWYRVSAVAGTAASTGSILAIGINSATGADYKLGVTTTTALVSGARDIELKAGDKVYITIYQNSGSAQNLNEYWAEASISKLSGSAFMSPTARMAARYKGTSGPSLAGSYTQNVLKFITKDYDDFGLYNPTTGIISILEAGVYKMSVQIMIQSPAATDYYLAIRKEGVSVAERLNPQFGLSGTPVIIFWSLDTELYFNAGDQIDIVENHGSASSFTLNAGTTNSFFSIRKVK